MVITEDNRVINLWQEVFNKMRRLHLIPIVRVATKEENGSWKKPISGEIDAWASHSYPNPNFSGSEYASGRGTIKTFEWEISFLKSLGVKKDLPVFITETGWAHQVKGNKSTSKFLNESQLSLKFERAFKAVWNASLTPSSLYGILTISEKS